VIVKELSKWSFPSESTFLCVTPQLGRDNALIGSSSSCVILITERELAENRGFGETYRFYHQSDKNRSTR
jgi:hypothetical protein